MCAVWPISFTIPTILHILVHAAILEQTTGFDNNKEVVEFSLYTSQIEQPQISCVTSTINKSDQCLQNNSYRS